MVYSFADGAYDYHVTSDLTRTAGERVGDARAADVAHALRRPRHVDGVRRLLLDLDPVAPLSRLSDHDAADRLARYIESGRVRVWRTGTPVWGRAGLSGAGPELDLPGETPAASLPPAVAEGVVGDVAAPELPRCSEVWAEIDAEVDAVLARGGDANPIERNRHITATYARYYQRMQGRGVDNPWAGVAAIVSGQAGCSMEYADVMIAQGEVLDEMGDSQVQPGVRVALETAGIGYQEMGQITKDALADTNKYIFDDIYPVLRMHERYGMDGIDRCGDSRPGRAGRVADDLRDALQLVDEGGADELRQAGRLMAQYEQSTIVQNRILDDWTTARVFDINQAAASTEWGRDFGARRPELALTAECPPYSEGIEAVPFNGRFTKLSNRVRYYQSLAREFGRLPTAGRARTLGTLARRGL